MNSEIVDNLKTLLKRSHTDSQLFDILMKEKPGFQTTICGLTFVFNDRIETNDWDNATVFLFNLAGNSFKATDEYSSWKFEGGPSDLLDNIELISTPKYEGNPLDDSWESVDYETSWGDDSW